MAIPLGTILKCVVSMVLQEGQTCQNVFYWQVLGASPPDEQDTLDAIQAVVEMIFGQLDGSMDANNDLTLMDVHEWEWDALDGWHTGSWIGNAILTDIFAGTGDQTPAQVAGVITGFTDDVNCRSRKSFSGFSESANVLTEWTAGTIAELAAAANIWTAPWTIAGTEYLDPGVPALGGIWRPFVSWLVSSICGTQRQRKPGIGI